MNLKTNKIMKDTKTNDEIFHGILASTSGFSFSSSSSTTTLNQWSEPIRLEVNILQDSIEAIFEETSNIALLGYPTRPPEKRYFKIIFSCVEGKWNQSERIYGKKIEVESYFEF